MNSKPNKQSGFTLVEVIVSLALMIMVVITLHHLSQAAYANWENASNKAVAYNLIQQEIERLHNLRDKNTNTLSVIGTTWDSGIISSDISKTIENRDYNKIITVEDLDVKIDGETKTGLKKKVTVEIKWRERGEDKSLKGITYLTDWRARY